MRFITAAALYPDRQEQLKRILDQTQVIETAIIQAGEIEKRGACETLEKIYKDHSDESKFNQMRASLTTEAADFVRTLRTAEKLKEKGEVGSILAWYLKARKLIPREISRRKGLIAGERSALGKSRDGLEQRLGRGAAPNEIRPRLPDGGARPFA